MALAVCQLNELQEALVLEAKSKETFTRQIQELQDMREAEMDQLAAERRSAAARPSAVRVVEPVAPMVVEPRALWP
eukprot:g11451.t1